MRTRSSCLCYNSQKHPGQNACLASAHHAYVNRMPPAVTLWQRAPFAAICRHVQNRIEQLQVGNTTVAVLAWQGVGNAEKLFFAQFHVPNYRYSSAFTQIV